MAGVSIHVKTEIINWILQSLQFENVASSAIELLHKWQSGEKTPTFNQVEDMSKKTNIPFEYFFLINRRWRNVPLWNIVPLTVPG